MSTDQTSRRALCRAALCLLAIVALFSFPAVAGKKKSKRFKIEPGPVTMSAEEKAYVANPELGMEDIVVFVEESERHDVLAEGREAGQSTIQLDHFLTYHRRYKVLSEDARDDVDITLPTIKEQGALRKFWARVIHPDGTVKELSRDDLETQEIDRVGGRRRSVLKAALPGVEVGSVIDWGYEVHNEFWSYPEPEPIQEEWPTLLRRHRWRPFQGLNAAYFVSGPKDAEIEIDSSLKGIVIVAENLPPVEREPYMPPALEARVHFVPYYTDSKGNRKQFWDSKAREFANELSGWCGSAKARRELLAMTGMAAEAGTRDKLEQLYGWMGANIANRDYTSADERASLAALEKAEPRNKSASDVMQRRRGTTRDIAKTYACLARTIGARAGAIMAVDRDERYLHLEIESEYQFSRMLIELTVPGEQPFMVAPGNPIPFGDLPWWVTGMSALKAGDKGAAVAKVPVLRAEQTELTSVAELSFIDENEAVEVQWSRMGTGQYGYSRARLRSLAPKDREDSLLRRCGNSEDFEVETAESGGLVAWLGEYELSCMGELVGAGIEDGAGRVSASFRGPWLKSPLSLDPGERKQRLIFNYPWSASEEIYVHAPEGYKPAGAPAPVHVDSQLGGYHLEIEVIDTGYVVRRRLIQKLPMLKAQYYQHLASFIQQVKRADETPLEFVRDGGAG